MRIRTAVAASALAALAILGTAGSAIADGGPGGGQFDVRQTSQCKSHDLNLDVLGEVGALNGLLGNALNGEGNSGAQSTHLGSTMGCNNSAF
ncbi:hypothetical protein [Streptomyces sp. NPDC048650]|uniref:hypothetical protein n=1 Tax=unclassified Streptomyces TaxID=2593676 RepID=UPI00371A70AA